MHSLVLPAVCSDPGPNGTPASWDASLAGTSWHGSTDVNTPPPDGTGETGVVAGGCEDAPPPLPPAPVDAMAPAPEPDDAPPHAANASPSMSPTATSVLMRIREFPNISPS